MTVKQGALFDIEFEGGGDGGVGQQLFVTGAYALTQHAHLTTGIVKVILTRHVIASPVEQIGKRIAQHGVAAVADGQGAGGIGANVFDHGALATADCRATIVVAKAVDLAHLLSQIGVG